MAPTTPSRQSQETRRVIVIPRTVNPDPRPNSTKVDTNSEKSEHDRIYATLDRPTRAFIRILSKSHDWTPVEICDALGSPTSIRSITRTIQNDHMLPDTLSLDERCVDKDRLAKGLERKRHLRNGERRDKRRRVEPIAKSKNLKRTRIAGDPLPVEASSNIAGSSVHHKQSESSTPPPRKALRQMPKRRAPSPEIDESDGDKDNNDLVKQVAQKNASLQDQLRSVSSPSGPVALPPGSTTVAEQTLVEFLATLEIDLSGHVELFRVNDLNSVNDLAQYIGFRDANLQRVMKDMFWDPFHRSDDHAKTAVTGFEWEHAAVGDSGKVRDGSRGLKQAEIFALLDGIGVLKQRRLEAERKAAAITQG